MYSYTSAFVEFLLWLKTIEMVTKYRLVSGIADWRPHFGNDFTWRTYTYNDNGFSVQLHVWDMRTTRDRTSRRMFGKRLAHKSASGSSIRLLAINNNTIWCLTQ